MKLNEDLTNPPAGKTPDVVELDAVEMDSPRPQGSAGRRGGARYKDSPNCQKPDIFIAQDQNCCSNCCLMALLAAAAAGFLIYFIAKKFL
ncbi:MAG: hypothetical protein J6T16_07955 [Opitutales bacterium]|nr:hypothetical protein [Opitutales bacterium]